MAPVITINQLEFGYPNAKTPVFSKLDIEIAEGEFVAVVGSSGVGKSTLLSCLMGLINTQGSITFNSTNGSELRRAMLFQDARLLPWLRVSDNIRFVLKPLTLSINKENERIIAALQLAQISELADRWSHQLSGGQAQRVGLARALAIQPDILFMDEPFSSVDAITRANLQDALLEIRQQTKNTIFFVTHDITEATYLADRVILLAGSPSTIASEYPIDFPRPRDRDDPKLLELNKAITAKLAE